MLDQCANCGQVILFGGIKHGTIRYCNAKCYEAVRFLNTTFYVPENEVDEILTAFHQGDCPCCGGPGPVDYHFSYRIMSFLAVTRFETIPKISCHACAKKAKIKNFLTTLLLGWWGPGLIFTPIYLCKNLYSLCYPIPADTPSDQLREYIRLDIARHKAAEAAAKGAMEGDIPFSNTQ